MLNIIAKPWNALGTTGKTILVLTLLFFIGRTLGKH
jgi:hypothetical protein